MGFGILQDGFTSLSNSLLSAAAKDIKLLQSLDLGHIQVNRYVTDTVGEPTLRDILQELEKPGRDPRAQFVTAQ